MRISLISQGNAAQQFDRPQGTTANAIVGDFAGKSVFLTRRNQVINGIGPETELEDGDQITVVPNKRVGR